VAKKRIGNFRSCVFGGFNRRDVITYIEQLHIKLGSLERDKEELLNELASKNVESENNNQAQNRLTDTVSESMSDHSEELEKPQQSPEITSSTTTVQENPAINAQASSGSSKPDCVSAHKAAQANSTKLDSSSEKVPVTSDSAAAEDSSLLHAKAPHSAKLQKSGHSSAHPQISPAKKQKSIVIKEHTGVKKAQIRRSPKK